jgi:hypothetical protein
MIPAPVEAAKNTRCVMDVKMKKIYVIAVVLSLLLSSCEEIENSITSRKFWAQNFSTGKFYQINAKMLAENDLCRVWAENGSGVTEADAQAAANVYKYDIYYKMMNTFGYLIDLTDEDGEISAVLNTIQFVNWLAPGNLADGKLTILLMDIKDDYQKGVNDAYVAGYFWAGNLYKHDDVQFSNECGMIYIDINPGVPGSEESNETLAHELQHLMNFAGTVNRGEITDLWIDEGLSVTAEWVYRNEHSEQRLNWYNADGSGLLSLGNNFFVWGNHEKESQYAVLDDYATVYLFFQWLRLQSGSDDIFWKISSSEYCNYNAVISVFNDAVSSSKYSDWKTMLQDWLAANYIKSSTGRYGYGNDKKLNNIAAHYAPGNGVKLISLFPGEGVYSSVTGPTSIPVPAGNVKYVGLNSYALIPSGTISTGALLTYNANTAIDGDKEFGGITGNNPPVSPNVGIFASSGSRSYGGSVGPFPIGAGDMLRRKGKGGFSGGDFKIPEAYRGTIVNE